MSLTEEEIELLERMEKFEFGDGTYMFVHKKENCTPPCPIHDPSDHHMVQWKLLWRNDRGIFERICSHGIGHPDPDTIRFLAKRLGTETAENEMIHGCDGCCAEENKEIRT
jgi:hypothetical protein